MTETQQFERVGDALLVRAPAKLNLSLLIAGQRPDGFHAIETVMAKVNWYDEIWIEPAREVGIEFLCEGPRWAPRDATNLVYRAAELILHESGQTGPVRLTLVKNIPAGSGLGSGSSDAAATLLGLNAYLELGLSQSRLAELASQLGSDVAFFLNGPLALCTGRGEEIRALPAVFPFRALIILPDVNASTKEVYAHYRHDPARYERLSVQIHACVAQNRIDLVTRLCANMLEGSCFHVYEELGALKETVASLGLGPVCLSGSGSALFVLLDCASAESLDNRVEQVLRETGCQTVVVRNNGW